MASSSSSEPEEGKVRVPSTDNTPPSNSIPSVEQQKFAMKSMGQEYIAREKNAPSQKVEIGDEEVTVREKEWLRDKANKDRKDQGLEGVDLKDWQDRKIATTQYMDEKRAADHQVSFQAGEDANKQANVALRGPSVEPGKDHIFVMDGEGEVFAKGVNSAHSEVDSNGRAAHVHHSSFKAGEAVAGAGELKVDDKGFLKEMTDRSGHYRPGEEQTAQTLEHLEQAKGVNLDNTKVTLDRSDEHRVDKTTGMAREYLQGQVTQKEIDHRQAKIDAGADIQAKPEGQTEQTFRKRHNMADELKNQTTSVRETLDKDADRRATRVRKAGEYLDAGHSNAEVSPAARQHAAKDEATLKGEYERSLKESLNEGMTEEQGAELGGADDQFSAASDAYNVNNSLDGEGDPKLSGSDVEPAGELGAKKPSVRESLGNSLGSRQSQASNGMKLK